MRVLNSQPPNEHRSLEKFRQETEYVCLKLGVKDWETFLAEVRLGNIVKKTCKQSVLPEPTTSSSNGAIDQLLNQLFESMLTKRSTARGKSCECESPICSQERIPRMTSNDILSHQNSTHSFTDHNSLPNTADPFQTYKIEHLFEHSPSLQQHTLAQIIQQIDHLTNKPQQSQQFSGFETFRNTKDIGESSSQQNKQVQPGQESVLCQRSAKKGCDGSSIEESLGLETTLQKIPSEEWIRKSPGLDREVSARECMLAVENTKLRKQIRLLSRILKRQSFGQQSQI